MQRKTLKKVLSIVLTLCIFMSSFSYQKIATADALTHKTAQQIAQDWINSQLSGNAEISEVVELRDYSEQQVGDLITFKRGAKPFGIDCRIRRLLSRTGFFMFC